MPTTESGVQDTDYYQILGLRRPCNESSIDLSTHDVKVAYHRALLIHHPDKVATMTLRAPAEDKPNSGHRAYSIDQIVRAYQTLSDPILRATYDRETYNVSGKRARSEKQVGTHLGVEVLDLDDLHFSEETGCWSRSCRCGNEEGYSVSEADLERESEDGEIYVGCHGCSLFIKILFDSLEEDIES